VREALFSILYGSIDGARVLDLFAGTGALGFEALSRGAAHAIFIEQDKTTAELVRKNAQKLGFEKHCEVMQSSAELALRTIARRSERYDLAFLDPPYDAGVLQNTLDRLVAASVLNDTAMIVCEHRSSTSAPNPPRPYVLADTRAYGQVALAFFTRPSGSQHGDT
ncbi:MAG: 16S rRNA (guanine(966)-N(2))-methyltransferase RsmD, partial [Clostridia bacterium]|nr:16S rRNA (guanine(966)-N(2))-methyltransferase RsmD [Deltaproteobacteria bacterium]